MPAKKAWSIRPFDPRTDQSGLLKLWLSAASFDGSVAATTAEVLQARQAFAHAHGQIWQVAVNSSDVVIGVLTLDPLGTGAWLVNVVVNPAFRRQGLGGALLLLAPRGPLVARTLVSVPAAGALLEQAGFKEKRRTLVMRRGNIRPEISLPASVTITDDTRGDARRLAIVLAAAFGNDAPEDEGVLRALIRRKGCRVSFLQVEGVDHGVAFVGPLERAKKAERDPRGEPLIGVIDYVGLDRSMRGKGLSRFLVLHAMWSLSELGYRDLEVHAEARRDAAVDLYEKEGFATIDEEAIWHKPASS